LNVFLRGFQALCVLFVIFTLYSWWQNESIPEKKNLEETTGHINNVEYSVHNGKINGIHFRIHYTEGEIQFVYDSFYPNFDRAIAILAPGANIQILYTKKKNIWALKVNNTILADFEGMKQAHHHNANWALISTFIFISFIFLMQGLYRRDPKSQNKHELKYKNDVEIIEVSKHKVVLHEPPLYSGAILFLGFALLILALTWSDIKHHEWQGALFIVISIMFFLSLAIYSSIDSIIVAENKILTIHRKLLAIQWQRSYSAEDINTITVNRTLKGDGIKMKLASGKSKNLTTIHYQSLDKEAELLLSILHR
jgi:hypothetical protein